MKTWMVVFAMLFFLSISCQLGKDGRGGQGQPCYPDGTCNEGLVCIDRICMEEAADGETDSDVATEDLPLDGLCTSDGDCSNGLVCDGTEACIDGECMPGIPPDCEDDDPCTIDSCSEEGGCCVHEPLDADRDGYGAMEAPDATPCGGTDCDDGNSMIYPGAQRNCMEEFDYDCDTVPDREQFEKIGEDVIITNAHNISMLASLVWTGSQFCVAWSDNRVGSYQIYAALLSSDGAKIRDDINITDSSGDSWSPSLVWTGSEFGVAWDEDRDGNERIYFARFSSDGSFIGTNLEISNASGDSSRASLVWTGTNFGLAWNDNRDGNHEIYFARIENDGEKIGSDVRITNDPESSVGASLVWTGVEYGVSWADGRDGDLEIYFTRISSDGVKTGSDVRISDVPYDSFNPSMAWTGTEYGISWQDERDVLELYFVRVSNDGTKIGSDIRITNAEGVSEFPSLVWAGSFFGLAWDDSRDWWNWEIYFAIILSDGTKLGSDRRITIGDGASEFPSLTWTGTEFGVAWDDNNDDTSNIEIYFSRIGCEL